MKKSLFHILLLCSFYLISNVSFGQTLLSGQVKAAITSNASVDGIMVDAASGKTTFTDKLGFFTLPVEPGDTIFFYIGNKKSKPFLLDSIENIDKFVVSLENLLPQVQNNAYTPQAGDMEEVRVTGRNYHADSLANRRDYQKYFGYNKPTLGKTALGMLGSPVTALYEGLNKKKQRKMTIMRDNLLSIEQQGYIDNRFSPQTVIRFIGSQDETILEDFMTKYRPKYEDLHTMGEMELAIYITQSFKEYQVKYLHIKSDSTNKK